MGALQKLRSRNCGAPPPVMVQPPPGAPGRDTKPSPSWVPLGYWLIQLGSHFCLICSPPPPSQLSIPTVPRALPHVSPVQASKPVACLPEWKDWLPSPLREDPTDWVLWAWLLKCSRKGLQMCLGSNKNNLEDLLRQTPFCKANVLLHNSILNVRSWILIPSFSLHSFCNFALQGNECHKL